MDTEPTFGVIPVVMMEPGRMIRDLAKALSCGLFLAANTMVNGKMTNVTDMENSSGRTETFMRANGRMEEGAVKAN